MNLTDYINTIKHESIAIIGAGISNLPLIRKLLESGCTDVTVCDKRTESELGPIAFEIISKGGKLCLGSEYLEYLDQKIIFRTPGLMPFDPHLVKAAENGSVITSEMEVFFKLCPCRIIAVTGSDGKTTTTTIISELLKKAGHIVHLGGNIGTPLLCEVDQFDSEDFAVLELSSFQLHSMKCHPNIAVITNISPNHLDKHKDYQDYIDAKSYIFRNQTKEDILVLNYFDSITPYYSGFTASSIRYFAPECAVENGAFTKGGNIYYSVNGQETFIMPVSDILIPGAHNVQNYLAALSAAYDFIHIEDFCEVARSFKGVEHRLETVRELRGVRFINDSIGTSPTRTAAGLHSLKVKPIVIAGGYDKHIPFDGLGDEFCLYAKTVILTGATADKIETAIRNSKYFPESTLNIIRIDDFTEAVYAAAKSAKEGDIVLLSPACAAFDHFANFAERGKYFKKLVMELK